MGGDGGCGAGPRDGECVRSAGGCGAQDGTRERSARRCRDACERR
ncbi:hypothetical protein BURCENK562V_C3680 [Burkholderia cenocepacia K56-2Valvano]|nr:hypothetical protein BURCENK562V_C3680 [Burkholderia cenocepacia K56-2Valvano]